MDTLREAFVISLATCLLCVPVFECHRRSSVPPASDEKRLTKHLVDNYNRIGRGGRPIINSSMALTVKFGLAMIQMDLDERENTLTTSVWCRYRWQDEYLKWDPDEFGGVRAVRLSSSQIWIPDIMLYNTADTHKLEREVLVVVDNEGSVLWIPHRIYRSSCSVDVSNFPFDKQRCHITFGSWAFHGNELNLMFFDDLERMDISDLEEKNTEWQIINKTERRTIQYYDCCDEPYLLLVFSLDLKRKLVFSSFILTLPCIFLALMTLVVFWLPPARPDRTSLAMSLFASFLLLLLILVETAPPTASSVPTLGVYYCFNMVLIMLSIFLSSIVIQVNRKEECHEKVPHWIRVTIGFLGRICCTLDGNVMKPTHNTPVIRPENGSLLAAQAHPAIFINEDVKQTLSYRSSPRNGVHASKSTPACLASKLDRLATVETPGGGQVTYALLHSHFLVVEKQLHVIENSLGHVLNHMTGSKTSSEMQQKLEWQVTGRTLDRIFFALFVVAIIASLVTLFPFPK